MTDSLDSGWSLRRLDEIVDVARCVVQPDQLPPDTRYVGLEHIEAATGMHTTMNLADARLRSGKFAFCAGDVLFGKLRPNLRKVAVATSPGICSTDIIPLRPKDPSACYVIAFQLRSTEFIANVLRLVAGQNLPRIGVRDLLALPVPVPPAEKSAMLRELAALLDEARSAASELDRHVRQLHDSATELLYPASSGTTPLRAMKST